MVRLRFFSLRRRRQRLRVSRINRFFRLDHRVCWRRRRLLIFAVVVVLVNVPVCVCVSFFLSPYWDGSFCLAGLTNISISSGTVNETFVCLSCCSTFLSCCISGGRRRRGFASSLTCSWCVRFVLFFAFPFCLCVFFFCRWPFVAITPATKKKKTIGRRRIFWLLVFFRRKCTYA